MSVFSANPNVGVLVSYCAVLLVGAMVGYIKRGIHHWRDQERRLDCLRLLEKEGMVRPRFIVENLRAMGLRATAYTTVYDDLSVLCLRGYAQSEAVPVRTRGEEDRAFTRMATAYSITSEGRAYLARVADARDAEFQDG